MRKVLAIVLVMAIGGIATAGPFCRLIARIVRGPCRVTHHCHQGNPGLFPPTCPCGSQDSYLTSPMPLVEFKEEVQAVQAPSLPRVTTDPSTSPVQGIAGEKRPDAGPLSLIGLLRGNDGKLEIQLPDLSKLPSPKVQVDLPDLSKLDLSKVDLSKVSMPRLNISGLIKPETSESLDSLAPRLHTLVTFTMGILGLFGVGKAGPWVVQAVSGLPRFLSALSTAWKSAASTPPTASPAVIQAAASMTAPVASSLESPTGPTSPKVVAPPAR